MSNIIFEWNGGGILHNQLVTRPNFVNQPETIFEGPSIIFLSVTCLFRSKQRWIALPCPGQALETGPHQQRHEGKQVAACSAVVQRSDALSLTSKGSQDICFNALNALKWKGRGVKRWIRGGLVPSFYVIIVCMLVFRMLLCCALAVVSVSCKT